jgi:NAD(P)-dependent dehydrogenase (short-subunit alcohol dehydrogenase family)
MGCYLIVGGLGNVGIALAKALAKMACTRIVLTRRSFFLPKSEWARWLEADEIGEVSGKIRDLLEIEALGSQVLTLNADVSDLGQMEQVIRTIENRFGELHGVIHAADQQLRAARSAGLPYLRLWRFTRQHGKPSGPHSVGTTNVALFHSNPFSGRTFLSTRRTNVLSQVYFCAPGSCILPIKCKDDTLPINSAIALGSKIGRDPIER